MDKLRYFSENIDVKNKTVILRLDLNVPISEKKYKMKVEFCHVYLF